MPEQGAEAAEDRAQERHRMVQEIEAELRGLAGWHLAPQQLPERVAKAMETVPRHRFVPQSQRASAYENRPLPIGAGQTISQPFIVALMTALLEPGPGDRVLEIGTGSGYQAAILAELAGAVYSVETVPELADRARECLRGYANAHVRTGDGSLGWPEHAPYDRIIVTAASPAVPPALIEQLRPGGRMVLPVGPTRGPQELVLITRSDQGEIEQRGILAVAFVPLVSGNDPDAAGSTYRRP